MGRRRKRAWLKNPLEGLRIETMRGVSAILFFLAALFLLLAGVGAAGVGGEATLALLTNFLGWGYPLVPLLLLLLSFALVRPIEHSFGILKIGSAVIFLAAGLGLIHLLFEQGGMVGALIVSPLVDFVDVYVTVIALWAFLIGSLILILDIDLTGLSFPTLAALLGKKEDDEFAVSGASEMEENQETEVGEETEEDEVEPTVHEGMKNTAPAADATLGFAPFEGGEYTPPPLSLLEKDKGKPGVGDIKGNANLIKRTLQNFGISVEIDEVSIGPSVTRYALKPAEGVRLSKIIGLQNNLELALAAHPVRIEAPIPGRSLVGIEVPNTAKATVGLATLLGTEAFQGSEKSLLVTLGKDITGEAHYADINKMPHLLIAGATGSGKSVTLHAILTSLLFRNSPEMMRFILVDPKRVELTLYNNIPHLLTPVVTDPKKTILALKWAAKEMERRYDILESEKVRDISSYHKNVLEPALEKRGTRDGEEMPEAMPYIVIAIDELADIMQAYPRELESGIVRLAQMSRAVGIHLILSTQRPSVNVITGLIKANVPARIALQVSSQIDSRTILDSGGAEKLLGAGDMLYLSGEMSKPKRIQSAFISETETKKVVSFLIKHNESSDTGIEFSGENGTPGSSAFLGEGFEGDDDDLYEEAKDIVVHAGKASTSYLQRKLRVGYARAARLMDLLEERGVIGPADGSKPRDVLVSADEGFSEEGDDEQNTEGEGERDEERL